MKRIKLTLLAACTLALTSTAFARDFTIASWGGNYQDAQREAYFKPFAESLGIDFIETTYLGGLAEIKTMVDTGNVTWDLVISNASELQQGCDEGLFEELDLDSIAHIDQIMDEAIHYCGIGNVVIGNGLAYNSEVFTEPPQDWADFFDREKFPGKRGMRNRPLFNLEYALMADGVPVDKVYEVLSTPEGIDRAFAKLNTIKDLLQFWESGSQPVEWMAAGNVALSTAYNGRIITAKEEGEPLEFVWKNHIYNIDVWGIPSGSPYKEEAIKFFEIANKAENQAKFSQLMPYGPTNTKVDSVLSEDAVRNLPMSDNIAEALFLDDDFWLEHGEELEQRWNSWSIQ